MRIRASLQRSRRWLAISLVVLGLGGAIAVHHGMPEGMAGNGHADHVVTTCLGVIAAAVSIVGAVGAVVRRRRRRARRPSAVLRLSDALARPRPLLRARAGPPPALHLALGVVRR